MAVDVQAELEAGAKPVQMEPVPPFRLDLASPVGISLVVGPRGKWWYLRPCQLDHWRL